MTFFPTSAGSSTDFGSNFSDPNQFASQVVTSTTLYNYSSAAAASHSGQVAFWTNLGNQGAFITSAYTGTVWNTVLSVSSTAGQVFSIIGPESTTAASNHEIEITANGITRVLSAVVNVGYRMQALGATLQNSAIFTGATAVQPGTQALSVDRRYATSQYANGILPGWWGIDQFNLRCLALNGNDDLLIRIRSDQSIANTTAETYAGAVYRLSASD